MTPLRQRMLEDIGIRSLAETPNPLLQQIATYSRYFNHSLIIRPEEIRTYRRI